MSFVSTWILSIAGICVLSVIVDLMLPEGQTNKYIKSIFAFFVVLVIISPLPKLVNKEYNIEDIFKEDGNYEIQDDFIFQLNSDRLEDLEKDMIKDLEKQGIYGVDFNISANIFTTDMKIDTVFVDLFNLVIKGENQHINTNEIIVQSVQKKIKIEKEKIIFNE